MEESGKESRTHCNRAKWANGHAFVLSAIGFTAGISNVCRFPYRMYQNGRGAFLIPYFLMMVIVGFPILFLEFVLGQYSGQGPTHVIGNLSPAFKVLSSFLRLFMQYS